MRASIPERVAIVTGASEGIGLAISKRLSRSGAAVVLVSRRQSAVDDGAGAVEAAGGMALGVAADVRDREAVVAAVGKAITEFGRLDVLVNNAGGSFGDTFNRGPLMDLSGEDLIEAYRLNVVGAFLCSQAAVPHLRKDGGGVIVNIGSIAGIRAPSGLAAYGASKAALANLTRSMADEWAPEIRVCGVAAGFVDTSRVSGSRSPERLAKVLDSIALHRLGTTEDVASAVDYLASPAAAWNTGSILEIHGGQRTV